MVLKEDKEKIISKFKANLKHKNCKYCSKIIDNHIIIDVPKDDDHFWSPQLSIEVLDDRDKKSVVKGLFGPKPQVWTLFMFIHFVMAFAFIGFGIMAYVKWTLKSDYTFALTMVIIIPFLWVLMYFLGSLGKKKGHNQMDELHQFMMKTIGEKQ
jgi:ABC-type multidrug transport system fused ATPase/permease subunit